MQVGQKVQWQSQGKGSSTVKTGSVVRIVKKGENPYVIGRDEFPNHEKMFAGFNLPGGKRTKEAYLITVSAGQTKQPRLYMPVPKKVENVRG